MGYNMTHAELLKVISCTDNRVGVISSIELLIQCEQLSV